MNFYEEYEAPGPEGPTPHGIRRFFQLIAQNCDTLLKVNLLFLLTCVPIITIPPALYSLHRITRRVVTDKAAHIWSQYWEAFRKEWKQAYIAFFISIIPMVVIGYGAYFYLSQASENILFFAPFALCIVVSLTLLLGSGYLYGLLSDERGLSRKTVSLALRLGLAKPLRSILAAVSWYGMLGLTLLWFPYSGAYLLVIGCSLPCLLWQFFIRIPLEKFT